MIDSYDPHQKAILCELFWKFTVSIICLAVLLAVMMYLY